MIYYLKCYYKYYYVIFAVILLVFCLNIYFISYFEQDKTLIVQSKVS